MMSWNYRIIAREDSDTHDAIYALHEVFYGQDDRIEGWTKSPVTLSSDSLGGIGAVMLDAQEALEKPVLWWEGDHLTEKRGPHWNRLPEIAGSL